MNLPFHFNLFIWICLLVSLSSSFSIQALPSSKRSHRRHQTRLQQKISSFIPPFHMNILPFPSIFLGEKGVNSGTSGVRCGGGGGGGGENDIFGINEIRGGLSYNDGGGNKGQLVQSFLFILTNLLHSYSDALQEHPYLVKIISSGIIGGIGDFLIQKLQSLSTNKPFDRRRFLVFTTVAAFYIAPVINIWFNWLSGLPMLVGMSDLNKALIMTAIDQTVGAVVINAGFFYAFEIAQRLFPPYDMFKTPFWEAGMISTKNNIWDTLVANWYCWPVINFLNFLFIPLQFRVLVSNLAAVFWNMFLSSIANRKK